MLGACPYYTCFRRPRPLRGMTPALGRPAPRIGHKKSKRARLMREVKRLAVEADDDVIDARLKNIEQFRRIPRAPHGTDEGCA